MIVYLVYIIIPLLISNVIHMIFVRWNWFAFLNKPIFNSLFGANKTWRGLIVLTILNGLFFSLVNTIITQFEFLESIGYGLLFGIAYIVFELPNSMLKRYVGIPAGERSKNHPVIFSVFDKSDSAFGVALFSKLLFGFSWMESIILFFVGIALHILFSVLLVLFGVKRNF
jgi:hypothetical protein